VYGPNAPGALRESEKCGNNSRIDPWPQHTARRSSGPLWHVNARYVNHYEVGYGSRRVSVRFSGGILLGKAAYLLFST
jgi:hypothetical protein